MEGRTPGGFAYDETVSTEMGDTSAMYAAASAAALNSAPPTEAGSARTPGGGEGRRRRRELRGARLPRPPRRAREVRTTSSSRRGTRRTRSLTRDAERRTGAKELPRHGAEIASIAAKIAAAAHAQNPGEAPETVAKRVAAAMSEALEAQNAPRAPKQHGSPALWDERR